MEQTTDIATMIWRDKYQLKELDGTPIDKTPDDTWRRVAKALALGEKTEELQVAHEAMFYDVMASGEFSPAGRIIAGAGSGRRVTLSNCFTMGTIPDSMDGIFTHLREAALTMQQGGGIGYDFSTLRPKGAPVKGVAADSSGPLTFMDVWDAMCRTIMSAGSRRGAMMATMRCDHPDIEAFIEAKRDPLKLRMFNLSVLVTDAFMRAVRDDSPWRLHFEDRHGETLVERTVSARELWDKIMRSTYDFAEPGVIFIDRVNQDHNLSYLETIATTNPCGEKPMGPYASCLLGSVNLAKLVKRAFRADASLDYNRLEYVVSVAIRAMDNVIEVGGFPLEAQRQKAMEDRQLGLGVTGLADALVMLNIRYGSTRAVEFVHKAMGFIANAAYTESIRLAKEKGPFPTFDADKFLSEYHFANRMLSEAQKAGVRKVGIRNGLLLSIAPTGTISLYAGNVSSGIEPIFAGEYTRTVLQPDGSKKNVRVVDYALAAWEAQMDEDLDDLFPPAWVTAQELKPAEHVRMQAAAQRFVDSSISKTVNCPEDISFEDFKSVYELAYESGCKGCTTYRPNAITGSILTVDKPKEADPAPETAEPPETSDDGLLARPEALPGATYKIEVGSNKAVYLTISDMVIDGATRPFEIFLRSSDPTHDEWMAALARMISAIMRRPHSAAFVPDELRRIHSTTTGGFWKGRGYQPSIVAAIGLKIKEHMEAGGPGEVKPAPRKIAVPEAMTIPYGQSPTGPSCKNCGSFNVKMESGCFQCLECGDSKCG